MDLKEIIILLSVGAGIAVFISNLYMNRKYGRETSLDSLIVKVLSAFSIPPGFLLLYCAFNPDLIIQLGWLRVYIAIAGMVVIFIAFKNNF